MHIWIVNPFDQLPNETDVPLRYWTLCRMLAEKGHSVIWWSSDFSHLRKTKRLPCPPKDGFEVKLIPTPPYTKNISWARLKNHRAFADGFYREALAGLKRGQLKAPDRIVVSLPPLGVAEQAFRIRDQVNRNEARPCGDGARDAGYGIQDVGYGMRELPCEVVVDIMDAWPETFYRALPKFCRNWLGPILLGPLRRSAARAYAGANKISAVGQTYLDLAEKSLTEGSAISTSSRLPAGASRTASEPVASQKPTHLCYHGTDLERFAKKPDKGSAISTRSRPPAGASQPTHHSPLITHNYRDKPLKAVYLGAMGSGYDLKTILQVAARWQAEGRFPVQIHFAGDGPQREALETKCIHSGLSSEGTISPPPTPLLDEEGCPKGGVVPKQPSLLASSARVVFHGYLQSAAISELLLSADLALVPNRPESLVACPYKAGEYAAAGLPMLSCLGGELCTLLKEWDAGSEYKEGDMDSLHAAFEKYLNYKSLLQKQSLNTRKLAEALFDRDKTYSALMKWITTGLS
jgi:glycosyltransferase involved in cell wall biosynthesis